MAEHTRTTSGTAVVALGLGALALMVAGAAAALLADLRWGQVVMLALLVPMSASTLVGLAALGLATAPRGARASGSSDDLAARERPGLLPSSPQRQAAERDLVRAERALARAVEADPQAPSLTVLVLALHEARLALARVVLVEDGQLSSEMADELVVAHRGVAALLRSSAAAPDRPDA